MRTKSTLSGMINYEALYKELRGAVIDYHSAYDGSALKHEAYVTIAEHASGRARDKANQDIDDILAAMQDYH